MRISTWAVGCLFEGVLIRGRNLIGVVYLIFPKLCFVIIYVYMSVPQKSQEDPVSLKELVHNVTP